MFTLLDLFFPSFPFFLCFEGVNVPPDTPALRTLSQGRSLPLVWKFAWINPVIGQEGMTTSYNLGRFRLDSQENFFPKRVVKV